jgi:spore maturation protein CgeB
MQRRVDQGSAPPLPEPQSMKIFVLGKRASVIHWTEDAIAAFRTAGHEIRFGVTRDPRLSPGIERLLLAPWTGAPRAAMLVRAITRFSPDLILAIAPYHMPLPILQYVANIRGRAPLVGWIGDAFSATSAAAAALFDAVAYTDTGLLAAHRTFGWPTRAAYLPHAANPRLDHAVEPPPIRHRDMVFVANPTPQRRALLRQLRIPMRLFGVGWTGLEPADHEIHPRFRVAIDELASIYRSAAAVLNIRNERNALAGLNQRHFDPYLAATPVVSDDQPDLALCFDPGTEVLVYRDAEELNDLYARIQRDPAYATRIGEAGQRRVRQEHTYQHRLAALVKLA